MAVSRKGRRASQSPNAEFLGLAIRDSDLQDLKRELKELDPKLHLAVSRKITQAIRPTARSMAAAVPMLGVPRKVRGFGSHQGRTRWTKVKGQAYSSPFARPGKAASIARIELFGTGEGLAAFKIADLAGTRGNYANGFLSKDGAYTINGQGQDLVTALTDVAKLSAGGRGGRFAWAQFMRHRPELLDKTLAIINDFAREVNRKFSL
jgi:hypothetical protein